MATITKTSSGSWKVQIRLKGHPAISRTFDTMKLAEEWSKVKESQMIRGEFIEEKREHKITLSEALDRYAEKVTPTKKGARQEMTRINYWKRLPLAQRYLSTITPEDMSLWRDDRLAEISSRTDKPISPTTVRTDIALVSHLYEIAISEWGMTSLNNPVSKIRLPRPAKGRERRFNAGEPRRVCRRPFGLSYAASAGSSSMA